MASYICIDGGTTNTRLTFVCDGKAVDTIKYNVGALSDELSQKVKNGISELSERNASATDIKRILASGMITADGGLYVLEHTVLPVGIKELHGVMCEVTLEDISDIPFVFMRGLKTASSKLDTADMLRGEETELMGLMSEANGECIYILPGSHSKIIKTDRKGRITDFTTMLTGEMLAALSEYTVLRESVTLKTDSFNKKYLHLGFEYCRKNGLNKALFKVRVLKNTFSASPNETYGFFTGAVLCGEILEILKINSPKIIIGGNGKIKRAMLELLETETASEIIALSDSEAENAAALGAVKIYEYKGV